MAGQIRSGYPTKTDLTVSCISLPVDQLYDFTSFIQIKVGNPNDSAN
jgi:hypothetical protein